MKVECLYWDDHNGDPISRGEVLVLENDGWHSRLKAQHDNCPYCGSFECAGNCAQAEHHISRVIPATRVQHIILDYIHDARCEVTLIERKHWIRWEGGKTMKHSILTLAALVLVLLAFAAGRQAGIHHAITDMEVYAVDLYDPDNPAASEWQGYDMQIYIDLDGQTYSHGLYVG